VEQSIYGLVSTRADVTAQSNLRVSRQAPRPVDDFIPPWPPKQNPPRLRPKMESKQIPMRQAEPITNCHGECWHPTLLTPDEPLTTPRVEKYRPVFLDDVVGNTETIERLKIIAKDGNMPHVIISGMPGIGKTTSILCLARQLLGDAYKEAVLELNASDERGIDVVRNRIKGFAQKKVTLPAGRQKLVILDEADSMTSGAQQALRRTMEIYSSTTRFAFACNQSNKIIEPLQSRCAILRYARLTDAQIVQRLMQICEAEKVEWSDDGIAALVFSAEGDMRQAINNLQSTQAGFGFVNGDNVFKVVDSPHPIKVQAMIKSCHECRIDEALTSLKELWDLGYSCHDIISTMFKVTKTIDSLSEQAKLEFIKVSSIKMCNRCGAVVDSIIGDWFYTHAHPRGRPDTFTAFRLRCSTCKDKHAAPAVCGRIKVVQSYGRDGYSASALARSWVLN
jgi:replication factor C subunit 2/4